MSNGTKDPRYRPKPKDGTQVEQRPDEPDANWFGPSTEPQEEFIDAGVWSKTREQEEAGRRRQGPAKDQVEPTTVKD